MHNPLRSEADAFRWIVIIGIGCASIIAVALLTRPAFGVVWALALIGIGIGTAWRSSRGSMRANFQISKGGDGKRRLLVVANQTVQGRELLQEIEDRSRGGRTEILVVTPALVSSRAAHWSSDVDEATELARQRMELSLIAIQQAGLRAKGRVGDSEPQVAIEDALSEFPADEIIISTHPPDRSRWLEKGVVARAREQIDVPVTHVVVDLDAQAQAAAGGT
jgi:uncharacterized membrane protein